MDYAYNRKQVKDFDWMLTKLIEMRNFRKKYKIQQTNCFLTNLSKNYTWNEKIKIKIDYLDDDYLIVLSSADWINKLNNKPLKFVAGYPKNWERKGLKKIPTFILINGEGLMLPKEASQAAKDCFNSLVENAIDIGENIEKNLYKFQKDISLKSFNITR